MRILFDSKKRMFKDPFGTLVPGQNCTLHIHIPTSVGASAVQCVIDREDGVHMQDVPLHLQERRGAYDIPFRSVLCASITSESPATRERSACSSWGPPIPIWRWATAGS